MGVWLTWFVVDPWASSLISLSCSLPVRGRQSPTLLGFLGGPGEIMLCSVSGPKQPPNCVSFLALPFPERPPLSPFPAFSLQGGCLLWMDVLQPEVYRGAPVVFIMTGLARAPLPGFIGCPRRAGHASPWEMAAQVQQTPSQLLCPNLAAPFFMEQALLEVARAISAQP